MVRARLAKVCESLSCLCEKSFAVHFVIANTTVRRDVPVGRLSINYKPLWYNAFALSERKFSRAYTQGDAQGWQLIGLSDRRL